MKWVAIFPEESLSLVLRRAQLVPVFWGNGYARAFHSEDSKRVVGSHNGTTHRSPKKESCRIIA